MAVPGRCLGITLVRGLRLPAGPHRRPAGAGKRGDLGRDREATGQRRRPRNREWDDRARGMGHPLGAVRLSRSARSFVLHHTTLGPVPGLETIRLHLADDALTLWRAVQIETGDSEAALPYWAFAWGGGLAIGRYLRDEPEAVRGRRVFDFATGSGLCAIAAMQAGAIAVTAADIDPFAVAAVALNARSNL